MGLLAGLRARARWLKAETLALALAVTDRRTPWLSRLLVVAAVVYAVSPLDLLPDLVPGLGWVDDLVVVPLLIGLAVRRVPAAVMEQARSRAGAAVARGKRLGAWAIGALIAVWVLIIVLLGGWLVHLFGA